MENQYKSYMDLIRKAFEAHEIDDFQLASVLFEQVIDSEFTRNAQEDSSLVSIFFHYGYSLGRCEKFAQAIGVYNVIIHRFLKIRTPDVMVYVARTFNNLALCYRIIDRKSEIFEPLELCIDNYINEDDIEIIHQVALSMYYSSVFNKHFGNEQLHLSRARDIFTMFTRSKEKENSWRWRELLSHASSTLQTQTKDADKNDLIMIKKIKDETRNDPENSISIYIREVLKVINADLKKDYFSIIEKERNRTNEFMMGESRLDKSRSFLLILREWNSYTPTIPSCDEKDRGGGYYVQHFKTGIVIDPGYDFIRLFHEAGGRLCDINNIIITHAHDDHTADFESLRMLIFRIKRYNPKARPSLYISASVERKFSGLMQLNDGLFERVVILNHLSIHETHIIKLSSDVKMIPLPAFHNDVVSFSHSIGVYLEFMLDSDNSTNMLFTGDTGYYPVRMENGKPLTYNYTHKGELVQDYILDDEPDNSLPSLYKGILSTNFRIDLLVSHIGSIQAFEFGDDHERIPSTDNLEYISRNLYSNHLGLLGTLMLVNEIAPELTIVSEFGGELKKIRIELISKLMQALKNKRKEDGKQELQIIPGDISVVYDIIHKKLLAFNGTEWVPTSPKQVSVLEAQNYSRTYCKSSDNYDVIENQDFLRVCLINKNTSKMESTRVNSTMKEFLSRYYNHKLPFHAG